MLPLHTKIDRTQRLLRMLEEDAPLLAVRVAPLTAERQQSAKAYAAQLTAHARAELEKLIEEGCFWDSNDPTPQAAD
jgi:alkylhydroperoxidase family enzyme